MRGIAVASVLVASSAASNGAGSAAAREAAAAAPVFAFSHLYTDSMVLQREPLSASVWGWSTPGSTVTVQLVNSADGRAAMGVSASGVARADGAWRVSLPPQPASTVPINVTATDSASGSTIGIGDVLFGDVRVISVAAFVPVWGQWQHRSCDLCLEGILQPGLVSVGV